jgi:general secretion pathway protein L
MLRISRQTGFTLGGCVDWWLSGLLECLPGFVRRLLLRQRPCLVLEPDGERFRVYREGASGVQVLGEVASLEEGGGSATPRGKDVPVLRVPRRMALIRDLTLPQAAEENLREVVGFEMDRYTPFQVVDAYYDFRIVERDRLAQQLRVKLVTVPRTLLDGWLERVRELGVAPAIVDVGGMETLVNLLPEQERPRERRVLQRLNLILVLLAVILGAGAAFIPVWKERAAVIVLAPRVEVAQKRAEAVAILRRKLEKSLESSQFLSTHRNNMPIASDVLLELTRLLPDGTWLSQLTMKEGMVDLRGESTEASALIARLQGSALFQSAEFRSPITTNSASGRDRFYIQASIAGKEPKS